MERKKKTHREKHPKRDRGNEVRRNPKTKKEKGILRERMKERHREEEIEVKKEKG